MTRITLFIVSLLLIVASSCTRTLTIRKNLSNLRKTWAADTTGNFALFFPKKSFADSSKSYLKKSVEKYRADILGLMEETKYTPKIDVFFFPSKAEMNNTLKTNAEGISFAKDNVAAFIFARNFNGYTRHELSHIFSINLWGRSALWIEEGFATLTDESLQTMDFHKQAKAILNTKDFIPAEKLFSNFNDFDGNWYRYAEAASLLKYVLETYGIQALKKIWKNKALYFDGKQKDELIIEWLAMLKNHDS